jgi:LmbE family N-acetylglucosaminyl deacetylase
LWRNDSCVEQDRECYIAILGEGITSRYPQRSEAALSALESLHEKARAVGSLLGAASVTVEKFPDNRFDEVALLDVVRIVEGFVDRIRPSVIYTHHPGDLNIDHAVTFRAVLTATRPTSGFPVKDLYAFEVNSSTEWAFQQIQPAFQPNVFVDVTATIDRKIQGMEMYEGEARPFPHPRSADALRAQARRWGSVAGLEYAEAFQLIRSVRG